MQIIWSDYEKRNIQISIKDKLFFLQEDLNKCSSNDKTIIMAKIDLLKDILKENF